MGDADVAAGRREGVQEVFADAAADEARGVNQAESAGQRSPHELWHSEGQLMGFWHSSGAVGPKTGSPSGVQFEEVI